MGAGEIGALLFFLILFLWLLSVVLRPKLGEGETALICGGFAFFYVMTIIISKTAGLEYGLLFGISAPLLVVPTVMYTKEVIPVVRARKKYGKDEFLFGGRFPFIGGLNLPEGALCMAIALRSRVVFTAFGQEYSLPADKIISASVMTKRQIQRQYVSSAGGAVAGAMLLGPVGALIGGAAGQRSIRSSTKYLIFTYQDGEEIKYIVFDATGKGSLANRFKRRYKERRQMETVKIDL